MDNNDKIIDFEIDFTGFPFDKNKLRSILENVDKETATITNKKKTKGALKMTIISSIIIGLITSAVLVFNGGNEGVSVKAPVNGGGVHSALNSVSTHQPSAADAAVIVSENSAEGQAHQDATTSDEKKTPTTKDDKSVFHYPVLVLSDEELAKMNVFKNGRGYVFVSETLGGYGFTTEYNNKLKENNYPSSGILHEMVFLDTFRLSERTLLPYEGWSHTKSEGVYPYSLNTKYRNGKNFSGSLVTSFGFSPLDDRKNQEPFNNQMTKLARNFLNSYTGNKDSLFLEGELKDYPFLDKFIPVYFSVGSIDCGSEGIIWFPATKYLVDRLPQRYRNLYDTRSFDDFITDYVPGVGLKPDIDNSRNFSDQPQFVEKQIGGLESLDLTLEELEKTGVEFSDGKIATIFESKIDLSEIPEGYREQAKVEFRKEGYDVSKSSLLIKTKYIIDTFSISVIPVRYTGWNYEVYSETAPLAITLYHENSVLVEKDTSIYTYSDIQHSDFSPLLNTIGKKKQKIDLTAEAKYKTTCDRLLPVTVNFGSKQANKMINFGVAKIWFYVNREFASLLPERYRTPILKELDIIERMEQGKLAPEDACDALKGEKSYLNLCPMSSTLFSNFSVSPNPLESDNATINLELLSKATLSFDLYNLQGELTGNVIPATEYNPGTIRLPATLKTEKGIFMLAVTASTGERAVIKIIK